MKLLPLFDNLNHRDTNLHNVKLPAKRFLNDFTICHKFLCCYAGSEGTYNAYRRETERLLQWAWHIKNMTLKDIKREHIEEFIRFCQSPPDDWKSSYKVPRYLVINNQRVPNPVWRPFAGEDATLSKASVAHIFTILSTLFNFLVCEEYLFSNPVQQIRQKSQFIQKGQEYQAIRRLSKKQWDVVEMVAITMADLHIEHERTLFMLKLLYGLYLRVSELTARPKWIPKMRDFFQDQHGRWWFEVLGKGNKVRTIAVNSYVLTALKRYRRSMGLPELPNPNETIPLFPRHKGDGAMSNTASIRRIIQKCFDEAQNVLIANGQEDEAENLQYATVHWLRHTGISDAVRYRPREHVRDDAGHSSSAITDRYIDVELSERHKSAQFI